MCDGVVEGKGDATGDDGVAVEIVKWKGTGDGDRRVGVGDGEDERAR